ncbi:MAG: glycosyltransferase [Bacteroidetes bacterium]|nr:glycosyltransferase [Bacteroidota bacterium]
MTQMDWIFILLLLIFGVIYIGLIMFYTWGWFHLDTYQPGSDIPIDIKASIIIPARNEEDNIGLLLEDLAIQDAPNDTFEIIIADDNSSDNTVMIVEAFIKAHAGLNIRLIRIRNQKQVQTFKKHAISTAIADSTGDLIITTDADCRVNPGWLSGMMQFYQENKPKMILAPVAFHHEKSLFEKMQSLEFLSLIAITGGAIRMGNPVMCNGANLAYEKKAFYETGGFDQDSFTSGDDVFLLLKMKKKYGSRSIRFLKYFNSIVYTKAQKTLKSFYHQRTRWASKNKGYDLRILLVSFSVYMVNLLLVVGFFYSLCHPGFWKPFLIATLLKAMIDIPILIGITTFVKQTKILLYGIPLILFYPIYIVFIGAMGIVATYQWKGRKVTK